MDVLVTDHFIYVRTPDKDRYYVQDVLNGVWSKKYKAYRFPKNIHAMRELLKSFPQLKLNDDFIKTGLALKEAREKALAIKNINPESESSIDEKLRPYQNADILYLKHLPSAGIFNEPRTGKTPTTIVLLKKRELRKNLVICPASLVWNWAKEFQKWWPECETYPVSGNYKKRKCLYDRYLESEHQRVLIVSKDTFKTDRKKHLLFQETFDACVVDEAHFLRNYKTLQSESIFEVKAKHRYALTGTPAVRHAADIWGILHFLYPEKFPSYWQFVERYFEIEQNYWGANELGEIKPHRKDELQELIGFISVQRKRKEVMKWLPDKQYITLMCEMDEKQSKAYEQMLDEFVVKVEGKEVIDAPTVLAQLMRLRQICLDPGLLGLDAPSIKTKVLLEWMEDNPEPVVIMSMFTSYLKRLKLVLEEKGYKVDMIHGEMSNEEKFKTAEKFQAGDYDVLLCNIISAGTGFTLDRAEVVIFTDKPFNPVEAEQAEDRIVPTTEERNHKISVINLICKDTVDEQIDEILKEKKSITEYINSGGYEAINRLLRGEKK